MSPLTPDERAEAVEMLRHPQRAVLSPTMARLIADKLEAEPEPDEIVDAAAEHISRWLNAEAWDIIERGAMPPEKREEYAEGLRVHARRGLASMPGLQVVNAETVICCDEAKVATPGCDHVHGLETLGELIDAYSNPRAIERERDEAREALRKLIGMLIAISFRVDPDDMGRYSAVFASAESVLEDVERTHALVPLAALERAAAYANAVDADPYQEWARAFAAAARGEHVEWPS